MYVCVGFTIFHGGIFGHHIVLQFGFKILRRCNILEAQVFSGAYERDWEMNDQWGNDGNIYIFSKRIILTGEWGILLIIHFP